MLSGRVWIDEMYFEDTRVEREPGAPRRRGLSKDKVCVVVAIDSYKQAMAVVSENGKPSTKRINKALKRHIRKGSTIVHDCDKAHNALVMDLGLVDERYKAVTTDPEYLEQMTLVNHLCSWIRRYVERFACLRSENLQAYLDWFVYLHWVHRDEEVARRGKGGPPSVAVEFNLPAQMVRIYHHVRRPLYPPNIA